MPSNEYAIQEAMRIANSSAGQQLLNLLQNSDRDALNNAVRKASEGNYADAQSILKEMLSGPKAQEILRKLGENHG